MNREMNAEHTTTMTDKEKEEWRERKAAMEKDVQKGYDDLEDDICNFHYIWYNKGKVDTNLNHHIKVASFDTWVKERSNIYLLAVLQNISVKWLAQ